MAVNNTIQSNSIFFGNLTKKSSSQGDKIQLKLKPQHTRKSIFIHSEIG